jgi:hypothetical protein
MPKFRFRGKLVQKSGPETSRNALVEQRLLNVRTVGQAGGFVAVHKVILTPYGRCADRFFRVPRPIESRR